MMHVVWTYFKFYQEMWFFFHIRVKILLKFKWQLFFCHEVQYDNCFTLGFFIYTNIFFSVTSGAGNVNPVDFREVYAAQSIVFCAVFCISLFVLFLLAFVLSVLLWFTASDYSFVLSVLLWFTASDYPFGILTIFSHIII